MKGNKKSLFYHAGVYWIGKMLARSVSFILLPIYTAYIAPAEYGVLSVLGVTGNILALVLSFQLPTAIYRFYAKASTEQEKQRIIGTSFSISCILPTLLLLLVYIKVTPFAQLLGVSQYPNLLRLLLFEGQVAIVLGVFLADMRINDESHLYSSVEIAQNILIGLLSILLVVYFGLGITGMLLAQAIIFCFLVLLLLPRFLRRITLTIDRKIAARLLQFSLPLIPAAIAMAGVHSADRILIEKLVGMEMTGIYAIGYKFGMLVNMIVLGPFLLIWQPKSFEIAKKPGFERKFGEVFTYLVVAAAIVALMLTGFSSTIVRLMVDQAYWQAKELVPVVAWSYVFFAMSSVVNAGLLIHHKTKTIAAIVLLVFIVNILGNLLLIPHFGMNGAAYATLLSFALHFLITSIASMRHISIAFEGKKLLIILAQIILSLLVFKVTGSSNLMLSFCVNFLVLVCMIVTLYYIGFFAKLELRRKVASVFKRLGG